MLPNATSLSGVTIEMPLSSDAARSMPLALYSSYNSRIEIIDKDDFAPYQVFFFIEILYAGDDLFGLIAHLYDNNI